MPPVFTHISNTWNTIMDPLLLGFGNVGPAFGMTRFLSSNGPTGLVSSTVVPNLAFLKNCAV